MHTPTQLRNDLQHLATDAAQRRRLLRCLSVAALPLPLLACGGGSDDTDNTSTAGTSSGNGSAGSPTGASTCSTIPSETAGPYPGDGTNTANGSVANALLLSGIVRSDIRPSLGTSTVAQGVPLSIELQLVDAGNACAPLSGYAVYLWHCDQSGNYSMYSSGLTNETYLRGVQVSDSTGVVRFTTIFPGCYDGRYPHVHFEVYPSLATATSGNNDIKTSQLTFTASVFAAIYASSGYTASASNLARVSLTSDNVFGNDSGALQVANTSGSVSAGYEATLQVGVAA
jgi:protocatechuate 3,4-dioxygenase beta subunit